jgi:hypothetical protein
MASVYFSAPRMSVVTVTPRCPHKLNALMAKSRESGARRELKQRQNAGDFKDCQGTANRRSGKSLAAQAHQRRQAQKAGAEQHQAARFWGDHRLSGLRNRPSPRENGIGGFLQAP